jgi:hypothetical protein
MIVGNYVLDEMIFAFEHLVDDKWEDAYSSGEMILIHVPCEWYEDGKPKTLFYRTWSESYLSM